MTQALRFYTLILAIFLFLAINIENIPATYQQLLSENVDSVYIDGYNHSAALSEATYAQALDGLGITLHPGTTYNEKSQSDTRSLNHCKSLVYRTLVSVPKTHGNYLEHLTLYFADGRRGLGGGSTIILRCSNVSDAELASVMVHEIGHVVDTGLKTGTSKSGKSEFTDGNLPVYKDDISLRFYRISWKNESTLKDFSQNTDFVTGYAKSDPFEDFSETYNFYLLHGGQFREMTKTNNNLNRKYLFMKYFIFAGKEYDNDPYTLVNSYDRPYDATLLSYDSAKFLKS
jgi:hypothetical protein